MQIECLKLSMGCIINIFQKKIIRGSKDPHWMSSDPINAENCLQMALKHNYSDEKVKRCKQELNDSLELDKAIYFESMKGIDLKTTYIFPRSMKGKAIEYKNTNLCSDFAICEAFNEFFASVYKIDNEPLSVPNESNFPGIHE